MSKLTVAIICGGPSSEHEVSCVSGGGVLRGLDRSNFSPILIGITKAGKWVALKEDYPLTIINKVMPTIEDNGSSVELSQGGLLINGSFVEIDCAFSILHGEFGEDGKIQQLLEDAKIPYVGSGVQASADAMDKAKAKELFSAAGLRVAPGSVLQKGDAQPDAASFSYPVFVKPSSGGSSRGTHKVKSADALADAIGDAFLYDDKVLIENAIKYSFDHIHVSVSLARVGQAFILEVADQGIGINETEKEKIFENFRIKSYSHPVHRYAGLFV